MNARVKHEAVRLAVLALPSVVAGVNAQAGMRICVRHQITLHDWMDLEPVVLKGLPRGTELDLDPGFCLNH